MTQSALRIITALGPIALLLTRHSSAEHTVAGSAAQPWASAVSAQGLAAGAAAGDWDCLGPRDTRVGVLTRET